MESPHTNADGVTRLQAVQARVQTLARHHGWFADAIRAGLVGYMTLTKRYEVEISAMNDRERHLARDLLAKGRLFDPNAQDNPFLLVRVEGLCPVALADRLAKYGRGKDMPQKLEQAGAAAALAAMDRDAIYQARGLSETKRKKMAAEYRAAQAAKTHVSYRWTIVVSRPSDWQPPANPHSLDRTDLERFTDVDYRTIALYRLGGLADVGSLRPIVSQPKKTGDINRDIVPYLAWRNRFPIDDNDRNLNHPPLNVRALSPEVAEQLLADVETWAKNEAVTRGESLSESRPAMTQAPEFRPASWFGKRMAARLRMAARRDRKTKRVATRRIDGVVCYSVPDARQWWANDVPKEP